MFDTADDVQEFARELTNDEEYEERFNELVQEGMDEGLEPADHLEMVVETLAEEFVHTNDNLKTDVPGYGDLLVETFKAETARKFGSITDTEEFVEHLVELTEE